MKSSKVEYVLSFNFSNVPKSMGLVMTVLYVEIFRATGLTGLINHSADLTSLPVAMSSKEICAGL